MPDRRVWPDAGARTDRSGPNALAARTKLDNRLVRKLADRFCLDEVHRQATPRRASATPIKAASGTAAAGRELRWTSPQNIPICTRPTPTNEWLLAVPNGGSRSR
jgi:hypothetical protein